MAKKLKGSANGMLSPGELALIDTIIAAAVRQGLNPRQGGQLTEDTLDDVAHALNSAIEAVEDAVNAAYDWVTRQIGGRTADFDNFIGADDIANALRDHARPGEKIPANALSQAIREVATARVVTLKQLMKVREAASTKATRSKRKPTR